MTRGALGSLCSRYRPVLRKCRVKNALAKMFVAGTVMLAAPLMSGVPGSTDPGCPVFPKAAWSATFSLDSQENDYENKESQNADADSSNRSGKVGQEHAADEIYGGLATTRRGLDYSAKASGNSLTIEGSGADFTGQRAAAGYAENFGQGLGTADSNILNLSNAGHFAGTVFSAAMRLRTPTPPAPAAMPSLSAAPKSMRTPTAALPLL